METKGHETVGFIDVGTNSIHLLVVRFYPGSNGTKLYQDKESVRLGKNLYGSGSMTSDDIRKSALVIERFANIAKSKGAEKVFAFATCAARDAENSRELINAVAGKVDLRIISGKEEARLIALGVFGEKGPEERTLEMDIGGGSTEIIIRERGENLFADSLSMGAVRYAYSMRIDCERPVSSAQYGVFLKTAAVFSYHTAHQIKSIGFDRAVGSSGTILAIAEMCAARRDDKDESYFTLTELKKLMRDLCSMDMQERLGVPCMGKGRADIIIPGGAILESLMTEFGIKRMYVSQNGLKQGMMLDYQLSRGYTLYGTRESSVRALAARCQYDRHHAEAVARNSMTVFDQLKACGLHDLDDDWRNLLDCAAILHDIGELVNYTGHNILSQAIIEHSELPGFSNEEIHELGLMVRFHHKKFPGQKDVRFNGMSKDEVDAVRKCAMMLKVGDVLDRQRNDAVHCYGIYMEGNTAVMELSSPEDPSMVMWGLEKLYPDFRKVFGAYLVAEFGGVRSDKDS